MKKDDRIARVAARDRAVRHARRLGWFSIAFGLAELIAPRALGRIAGLEGRETLIRLHGLRQLATGIGLLGRDDVRPAMWARLGGDLLEVSTLAGGIADRSAAGLRSAAALAAVTGIGVVDARCALALGIAPIPGDPADYGDRSGFPRPPQAMRGAALKNFTPPSDLVGPQAMRSWLP